MSTAFEFDETQLRRSAPRQFTAWQGMCLLDGDYWRGCQVVDISPTGAGLLVASAEPVDVMTGRLVLSLNLPAEIRNMCQTSNGLRIGAEFSNVSDAERKELRKWAELGLRW
jgi:PilZ domain-containing protein